MTTEDDHDWDGMDETADGDPASASAPCPADKKLNPRQLQFARLIGTGTTQREAYRQIYGKLSDSNAYRTAQRPNVAAAIARYQRDAQAASVIKRDEVLRTLAEIIRTPVGELHEGHPLVQEITLTRRRDDTTITRIKGVSKMDAIKLLCQLCGWFNPEETQEPLTIVLKKMW